MSRYESTGILSEHEPYSSGKSAPSGYEPTEEEIKTLKLVESLFKKAKDARKTYDSKWIDNYQMFRGKQWKETRPAFRHSEVINLIFRAIQTEIPILTDSIPKPQFVPTEPNDFELSQILNDLLDCDWTSMNWSYNLTEMLYDSHFYGTSFGNIEFDPDAMEGVGAVVFKSADPFYMYPDKYARDVNEECCYFIVAEPRPLDELKREFPKVAEFLESDVSDFGRNEKDVSSTVMFRSPTDATIMEGSSPKSERNSEAVKTTCYMKDLSTIDDEKKEINKETGLETSIFIKKLKYPNGRKIITVSGVVCFDGPMPYDDGKIPYARVSNYILPREFWGMSEVEQLESPQKIFNKLISFSLDVLTLMGNPIWIVDTTAGLDTENLINRPGLVVEKEPGSEVRREEGVQLQPYVLQLIDRMKLWFDDVSGNSETSRGLNPAGVTSGNAIEALQSSANTRLRQKTKNIDAFMQNFGQMYLSRVFQFYTSPRVFRVTNNQNVVKYFKFHVDKVVGLNGEEIKIARVQPYQQGDDGNHYLGKEKQFDLARKFDIKISTGSVLPFEKNRIEKQSLNLFDRGIIDAEEVLNNIIYPNKEVVLRRISEKAQAAQSDQASMPPPKK